MDQREFADFPLGGVKKKKKNLKELKFFVVVQILNEQKATLGPLFANPRW